MNMQQMTQMLLDISNGAPVPANETKEEKKMRAKLTAQVEEIRAKHQIVDVPVEMS